MDYKIKFIAFVLFSNKDNKFKTGITKSIDNLLYKLNEEQNIWSLVHFEAFNSKILARKRIRNIKKMKFKDKLQDFILSKI